MSTQTGEKVHYPALDGLRGCGFLIVFLAHVGQAYKSFYIAGKVGVGLFFVLSAFFLTGYFARKMSGGVSFHDWRAYFVRRIMRLYPMYIVVLICEMLVGRYSFMMAISHLLLLDGRQHYWTIPVEFQFYVLMPLLAYGLFVICKSVAARVALLIVGFAVLMIIYEPVARSVAVPYASQTNLIFYVSSFMVGIILALVPRAMQHSHSKLLMYISCGLILLSFPYSYNAITHAKISISLLWIFSGYSVLWAAIVAGLLSGPSRLRSIMEIPMLRYLGTISYSAYLFHILVLNGVRMMFPDTVLVGILLSGICTILLASMSYKYIEKPSANLI